MGHLRLMLTIIGINSAQRFKLMQGANAPSLALYTIASTNVVQNSYSLGICCMGEWLPSIDCRHYRRSLFAGLEAAIPVKDSDALLIADRKQPKTRYSRHGLGLVKNGRIGLLAGLPRHCGHLTR